MTFQDRKHAGRELGKALAARLESSDVMVLGLDPGGLLVAEEVAHALDAPLDVFVVRKLMLPEAAEPISMGALATGGIQVIDDGVLERLGVPDQVVAAVLAQEMRELRRRERLLRTQRVDYEVRDRAVVLVDDGLSTGATMRAAIAAVRRLGARTVIVACPVGSKEALAPLEREADAVHCLVTGTATEVYEHFDPIGDDEILAILSSRQGAVPA